jgi:ATP/maltotriose-dependent transcriptional regulator MalT
MASALLSDGEGTLDHAQLLRSLAAKQPVFEGLADENMGQAPMFQGSWHEGIGYSRQAVPLHKTAGLPSHLTWAKLDEAKFLASDERIDEGLAVVRDALADSEEYALLRSPALRQHADLLAQSNADASTIDTAYRAAIECARSQGARYYGLQATTPFARWLRLRGRAAEGQTLLAEIYGRFTEGFHTPRSRTPRLCSTS